jgi:hypothetical protein
MSPPYRDALVAVRPVDVSDEPKPLASFDVSGAKGDDGRHGAHGASGGTTGAHGGRGGDAGIAEVGENAGHIRLELIGADASGALRLAGEVITARGELRAIRDFVVIDEHGFIPLVAVGGDGGRGGNGGRGGDGARGADGADATRWRSGEDGGPGGDGGDGGNATSGAPGGAGGQIAVTVSEEDTPLLMLVRHDIRGGTGGAPGVNGSGGSGGSGGRGGSSYSWTTTSTYRDANGNTQTRTHYHSNPGGSSGRSGWSGATGSARVYRGADGEPGSFAIRVKIGDAIETYASRYDLRLVSFSHDSLNEDAVYEPGELVRVFDLEVENVGGMPTPTKDELALQLAPGGWVQPEPGELLCVPGLAPGARYRVPGELRFRIADHAPIGPGDPLEIEESILQRAMLPSVRRGFEHYQTGDALEQGKFVIRYPVRVSAVEHLRSLAAGEATRVRFEVTNQSRLALGARSTTRRVVRVRVATAPDSELGDEHVVFVAGGRELAPGAGWTHEIDLLEPGDSAAVELIVRLGDAAPEYLRFAAHVTLELGALEAPDEARPIQLRDLDIRVARPFRGSLADVLLVVNHRTTREELAAWGQLGQRLAFELAVWDVSREGHLDLERALPSGESLAECFAKKAIVILDNVIDGDGEAAYPHVLLADDQATRAAAAGLDIALIGKGVALERLLVTGDERIVTRVSRTYWVRWWARPEPAWLEKQALRRSRALAGERPRDRYLVIHRFAPERDRTSGWPRRWQVGTLEVVPTLEAAAGALVHAAAEAHELHDPAFARGDRAVTALLVMFDFDEKLERLRRLLEAAVDPARLGLVIDALVLDLANELAAVLAPGWLGDSSVSELDAMLPRFTALARSELVAAYDTAGGEALRELAGRVSFLIASQIRWWEHLPPLRWARRAPLIRPRLMRHVDRFLAAAFGDHNLAQARADADAIAQRLGHRHQHARKRGGAGRRAMWALEVARQPIAERSLTSDTELLVTPDERVLEGEAYDAVLADKARDAARRDALVASARRRHAELLVTARSEVAGSAVRPAHRIERDEQAP